MKKFTVLLVMAFLTLMVSSVAFAREPQAPEGVNSFTVSPDPAAPGDSVTIDISANMTAGVGGDTSFCLYVPNTAVGTFPGSIVLTYLSGWTPTPVTFTDTLAGANPCPPRPNQTARLYDTTTFAPALPTGDMTYTGSELFPISGAAVVGTYDWTLSLEEPGGGVNPLSYAHEIADVETPDTGLSGTIIDSKDLQPWAYGAEIIVLQTTGANVGMKANTFVAADGTWSVNFGATNDITLCGAGCTAGNEYATYQVKVNFKCDLQNAPAPGVPGAGTRPDVSTSDDDNCPIPALHAPTDLSGIPVNFEVTVTDSASDGSVDVGDWETGRGPTAVSLQSVTANNNTTAIGIGFVVLMLAGVTFVMFRRREVA